MAKDKKVGSPIIIPSINMDAFKAALDRVARIEHHDPDVREQALKIARGLLTSTGQFSAKDTGRYYNIKHNINPADVQTTIGNIPGVKLKKPKNMSWEDFYKEAKGGTLINIGGDRSNLGRLTHINGQELAWPVDLHAGAKYMQEPNPGAVWANNATHGSALQNQILKAAEKGPVYGAFTPMGPGSVDSSHNMFDAVMAQIPNSKISKTDAKDFDEMIRGGYHVPVPNSKDPEKAKKAQAKRQRVAEIMQEWPGIMNAKQAAEFARNLNGDQRKDIIQFMDQGKYLKAGFPEIGVTRAAITDPALLATPGNMIGHRIVKFDPNNLAPASKKFVHSTYTTNTGGQYVGDVPLIQRHYAMPDVTEHLLGKPTSAGDIVHPYSLDQMGRATSRKMFEEQKQMQPINDKMINSIGEGQRLQEKYGFADGGEVEPVHIMHQHFGHPIFTGVEHKAGGGEVDQGQDSMTAYHGSPHNFDKFQTSQIGTGEGAQSFGHGLYFAQNEKVAKNYRDNLAGQNTYLIDHILQHAPELKNADSNTKMDLHKWAMNEKYDPHTAAKWAQAGNSYLRQIDPTRIANVLSSYKNAARGHMYEVGIKAHPDDFLDWDDYRANQSNTVNRAVRKLIEDKINKENPSNDQKNRYLSMGLTGRNLYSLIHEDPKEAARLLHEHGVKGIRYLDELSRHKDDDDEDKTHNYVVFNDKDVDIKRKYAQGGDVDNDVIPHGDPKREQNLTAFQKNNHPDVPPVAYHGTIGNFNEFSDKLKRSSTGAKSAEMGHWFTDTPRVAQSYAHYAATDVPVRKLVEAAEKAGRRQDWDAHDKYMTDAEKMEFHFRDPENEKRGQNIMPVHLSMKNPHVIDANGGDFNDLEGGLSKHILYAKRKGHDGLIIKNLDDAAGIAHLPATHYMVFHPHQIKSATGNQGTFDPKNPDITKSTGGDVDDHIHAMEAQHFGKGGKVMPKPKKTVKAYKLFRTDPKRPGDLFPLFVDANTPVPMGKWVAAKAGDPGKDPTKVKSKLGDLAYRPGWHSGDLPIATHIGGKSDPSLTAPDYRPDNQVWAEVEHPADKDWQSVANSRAQTNKAGQVIPRTAHITDQVPHGGFYRYKTNPNMTGNWLISGGMKVNRILSDDEVKAINDKHGVADLPRMGKSHGGDVGSPYEDAIKKAKEEYEHVGLRTVEKPITGNISASSVWDDGKPTKEKLNGVSATDVNAPKSRSQHGLAEKDWHVGYYPGNYTYVLGSHSADWGEDSGEKVMHDPKVVFGGHRDSILGKKPTAKLEGGTVNGYEGGGVVGHRVHFPSLSAVYD